MPALEKRSECKTKTTKTSTILLLKSVLCEKGPNHSRQLASAHNPYRLLCCRVIVSTMCQMKIYKASHLCRTNRRIFKRVRNNSNRDANHAAAYCFQLRSNAPHQNHFWIHASIRPYSRDSINRAFFHKFDCDFGKFSTTSSVTRQSILINFPRIFVPATDTPCST